MIAEAHFWLILLCPLYRFAANFAQNALCVPEVAWGRNTGCTCRTQERTDVYLSSKVLSKWRGLKCLRVLRARPCGMATVARSSIISPCRRTVLCRPRTLFLASPLWNLRTSLPASALKPAAGSWRARKHLTVLEAQKALTRERDSKERAFLLFCRQGPLRMRAIYYIPSTFHYTFALRASNT